MSKKIFSGMPMVRMLIPLVLGIVFAYKVQPAISSFGFLLAIFSCIPVLFFVHRSQKRSMKWIGLDGVIIAITLFLIGNFLVSFHNENQKLISGDSPKQFVVHALSDAVVKENSVRFEAEIVSEKFNSWRNADEHIIVYLKRDPSAEKIIYGDELVLNSALTEIEAPKNPDEFDYREFLAKKNIFRRCYANADQWKMIGEGKGNVFKSSALALRRTCFAQLQHYGIKGDELSVASALLLGNSDQIDPNLIQAYSASGVLHVLSVSGMHVALIYVILLKLLTPLSRNRKTRMLSFIIQLLFIWFYATLTGLCPSVLRSVAMLSIVIMGNILSRQSKIVNSLAASAFLLLLIEPMM
ncbi:MAG TPA: ComEC family competence protein, partial [Bacteroidia bacterium]|nr:ComEC family competence protein [Bacteroidia bacterium]